MKATKLIDFQEEVIERGTLIRCKGKQPYEEVVDFMLCESQHQTRFKLLVASGYKAGLTFCYLPADSVISQKPYGCSTKWLIENWANWGYADCALEDVWLVENTIPEYPAEISKTE